MCEHEIISPPSKGQGACLQHVVWAVDARCSLPVLIVVVDGASRLTCQTSPSVQEVPWETEQQSED